MDQNGPTDRFVYGRVAGPKIMVDIPLKSLETG